MAVNFAHPTTEGPAPVPPPIPSGRRGRASLRFSRRGDSKTFISDQYVAYPFHLTRPFYFDDDPAGMLSLYLQSASGGIYRGDDLLLDLEVDAGTAVHVTTQAATIVHDTRETKARQNVRIRVAEGAFCEYFPDPIIMFSGAELESQVSVELEPGAVFVMADAFTLHDPQGEGRPFRSLASTVRIEQPGGTPLAIDRYRIDGSDLAVANPSLDGGQKCHGMLFAIAPDKTETMVAAVREAVADISGIYGGVSALPRDAGIGVRILSDNALSLDRAMKGAWSAIRETLTGQIPKPRRK
ncbi:MAG: urease accessory protein UreD [Alphaproteobacteria bacterium]